MKFEFSNKFLIPFVTSFFIILLIVLYLLININDKSETVNIYKGNELIESVDLSMVDREYTIDLGTNTVLIERDGVSMASANCPDRLCVKQGKLSSASGAIVCLPNRIIIEFASKNTDVDAVAGAR